MMKPFSLAVVLMLACASGLMADEDLAIKTAQLMGGKATIDKALEESARVLIRLPKATNADLQLLVKNPTVGSIQIDDASKITDVGLTALRELPNLQSFSLTKCTMDDKCCEALGSVRTITTLYVGESKMTDTSFLQMKKMVKLKKLDLYQSAITDRSGPVLATMKNLEELNLSGTGIGDVGIIQLKELKNLRILMVNRTNVTKKGIEILENARGKGLTIRY